MFRTLRADEIELRVGTCSENGFSLLLYKDARCDMNILDETVGPMNWRKSYQLIDGQLFCTLEIWDETKQTWIGKQDVGTESNTEAEKGRASDAQKRAAVCFGIGRELYSAPFVWIKGHTEKNFKGKYVPANNFDRDLKVTEISYDENRSIKHLVIKDKNNKSVFSFKDGNTKSDTSIDNEEKSSVIEQNTANTVPESERPRLVAEVSKLIAEKGLKAEDVYKKLEVENLTGISTQRLPGMTEWLKKMKG